MDATLRDKLVLVEQRFLIAVVSHDEAALRDVFQEWSRLFRHFQAAKASGTLDDNTTLLLSRISQAIKATTEYMLECEDIALEAQKSSISSSNSSLPLDGLLSASTNQTTIAPCHLVFSPISSSGKPSVLGRSKILDACAYRWFMQNMHNPYPTSTQLQVIGDESNTSVAQVELWFQEARDSVGWTSLSHEFFTGSLDATITIAKRVYLEHDDTVPFRIRFAFFKVKAFIETLFLEETALPDSLASHDGYAVRSKRSLLTAHQTGLMDNEEIEDTTPPPSVAGCKRSLPEDTAPSIATDLHRPPKRLRCAQSPSQVHSNSEGVHDILHTGRSSKNSATEASNHLSVVPATSVQLSDPSFPVGSKPSLDPLAFSSTGQGQTDLNGSTSEAVVVSPDFPVSQGQMPQIPEGFPYVPSERQLSPSMKHGWHPYPSSIRTFAWPVPPSLDHPHTDSPGASQITINPSVPIDLTVFDWNSIPNPLNETTILTNQPASVYVPGSDLTALNFEVPDPSDLYTEKGYNPPCRLDDLGVLEDFSGLPQFPIPTCPPHVSASPPGFYCSDNSTFPSPDMDWSAITDFINQFTTFSAETPSVPSPSSTFDAVPSTPENPTGSLLPLPPHEVNKPISLLDPSIPPSAFLPAEPGIFTDDASNMWSLLYGLS